MSDPLPAIQESCKQKPEVIRLFDIYEKCGERLKAHGHSEHSCAGYFFDYGNELDKCVIPKLLKKLK